MANKARKLLINLGKSLPFALCFVLLISYTESVFSLITANYVEYGGVTILYTPISFYIAEWFEYDLLTVTVIFITSIAIEACKWNLFASVYLAINLAQKSYISTELEPWTICTVAITNALISAFFVYKGIIIITTKKK